MSTGEPRAAPVKPSLQPRCDSCGHKLKPKQKVSDKAKATRARKSARKAAKSEVQHTCTRKIRAACMKRAGDYCECGCGRSFKMWGAQMDHWHQGSAKRLDESVETCWMLTWKCHAMRQANLPSADDWNLRFFEHCEHHGYAFKGHVEHAQVERRRPPSSPSIVPDPVRRPNVG